MNIDLSKFNVEYHFASPVFRSEETQFLPIMKPLFEEFVQRSKNNNKNISLVYPCVMTELISSDERASPFVQYVSDIAWEILNFQGYDMNLFYTYANEMWGQHHPHSSGMDQHIHGAEVQLCGFYFIDTPPDSSRLFIHDPRAAKIYAGLPERKSDTVTSAHNLINFLPEPGDLIFTNPWLSHSLSRNASQLPFNFIHINIRVAYREDQVCNNIPSEPIVI